MVSGSECTRQTTYFQARTIEHAKLPVAVIATAAVDPRHGDARQHIRQPALVAAGPTAWLATSASGSVSQQLGSLRVHHPRPACLKRCVESLGAVHEAIGLEVSRVQIQNRDGVVRECFVAIDSPQQRLDIRCSGIAALVATPEVRVAVAAADNLAVLGWAAWHIRWVSKGAGQCLLIRDVFRPSLRGHRSTSCVEVRGGNQHARVDELGAGCGCTSCYCCRCSYRLAER